MAIPIAAEPVINIGSFAVTNSVINGVLAMVFFVVLALVVRVSTRKQGVPSRIQNTFEALIEALLSFMDQVTSSRLLSKRFLPLVGSLFLFILVSNWLGLFPGVGTFGVWQVHHGEDVLVPLLRPATSDLNMTLALAVLVVLLSHIIGAVAVGFFRYWNKFIQIGGIVKSIIALPKKKLGDGIMGVFTALIEFAVGLLELVGEIAKVLSLSLRLFGNVFAGEVLLSVIAGLIAYGLPLPFMALEIIVGLVQALVFSTLTLVYLTIAVSEPHGSDDHDEKHAHADSKHAAAH
jgi:F-type H+-transporting ATPase subunit a